jgi:hypothetical protein
LILEIDAVIAVGTPIRERSVVPRDRAVVVDGCIDAGANSVGIRCGDGAVVRDRRGDGPAGIVEIDRLAIGAAGRTRRRNRAVVANRDRARGDRSWRATAVNGVVATCRDGSPASLVMTRLVCDEPLIVMARWPLWVFAIVPALSIVTPLVCELTVTVSFELETASVPVDVTSSSSPPLSFKADVEELEILVVVIWYPSLNA